MLLQQRIGVEHQFLRQPLQVAAGFELSHHLLARPGSLGMQSAAPNRAIHLLGSNAGDQGSAAWSQLQVDAETISPHQSPSGMKQGKFAAAIVSLISAEQFERGAATPLVGGPITRRLKRKAAIAAPGIRTVHAYQR